MELKTVPLEKLFMGLLFAFFSDDPIVIVMSIKNRLFFSFTVTYLTVCYNYVTYAFQSESTLYKCLIVKELLAQSRRDIVSATVKMSAFSRD